MVLRCLGKGKGSAAAAAEAGSELPCSRLGGLDSPSPVHNTSSPSSSRHRRCRVPADVSLSHSWLWSGALELSVWGKGQFLLPLVLPIRRSTCGCSLCIIPGPASVSPSDHQDSQTSVCSGLVMWRWGIHMALEKSHCPGTEERPVWGSLHEGWALCVPDAASVQGC